MSETVKAIFLYEDFWEQSVSTLTSMFTVGEINPISVKGLIDETKAQIKTDKIARLEWYAHGSTTYIGAGEDVLHTLTPKSHMTKLSRLRENFEKGACVVLYVCQAGNCKNVMSEMAKAMGVDVYATDGDVRPMLYGTRYVINGTIVVARPDGSVQAGDDVKNVYYYETDVMFG